MEQVLKLYIRDKNKRPRGVAVAIKTDRNVLYGFSLCNVNLDRWDKKLGIAIALARATAPSYQLPKLQDREALVLDAFEKLEERATRYFKDLPPDKIKMSNHLHEDISPAPFCILP